MPTLPENTRINGYPKIDSFIRGFMILEITKTNLYKFRIYLGHFIYKVQNIYRASRNKWLLLYPRINGYLETDNSIR